MTQLTTQGSALRIRGPGTGAPGTNDGHPPRRLLQTAATLTWLIGFGGWRAFDALHPNQNDPQWVADATYHPLASMAGALVPAVVAAPFIYWISGKLSSKRGLRPPKFQLRLPSLIRHPVTFVTAVALTGWLAIVALALTLNHRHAIDVCGGSNYCLGYWSERGDKLLIGGLTVALIIMVTAMIVAAVARSRSGQGPPPGEDRLKRVGQD